MANSLKLFVDPNNANPSLLSRFLKLNEVRFSAGIVRTKHRHKVVAGLRGADSEPALQSHILTGGTNIIQLL